MAWHSVKLLSFVYKGDPDDLEKPDVEVNPEEEKDHDEVIKLLLMGKEKDVRNTAITSVKIEINGVEKVVIALMYTEASINIIPEHMLKIFNRPESNEEEEKEVKIVGSTAKTAGKEKAKIVFNEIEADTEFRIMKNYNKEILIGLKTMKQLNILEHNWLEKYSIQKEYKCKDCGKDCEEFELLESHRERAHDILVSVCKHCMYEFKTIYEKNSHIYRFHAQEKSKGNLFKANFQISNKLFYQLLLLSGEC